MRGSLDDAIENQLKPKKEEQRKPPGGKALLRLLQMLESRGQTENADTTFKIAVSDDKRKDFISQAVNFTAAPSGKPPKDSTKASSKRSKKSTSASKDEIEASQKEAEKTAQNYLEAFQNLSPPTSFGPQWRSLGPSTIPNGQTYGSSRVNVSGRVSCIAIDPHNPAHVLCGSAGGGVWESFNRGASWSPRTDYASTLTVGALAFDPNNPSTVYCGTGEGNFYWSLGAGILRSTNGGTTWTQLCTAPFAGQGFYELIVDRANSQHLLAGAIFGLYVSTDGGVTWTRRRTATTWSISMAPTGGSSAEILSASSDGLWRSTNGGTSWSAVTLPGSPGSFDRFAVAISPSNPTVAYAWGARGSAPYLWRRSGGTWTSIGTPPGASTGQAWYDWFVAAAPDRDTQVYCGAIQIHRGDLSGSTWTWQNITNKGTTGDSIHPDQHAIAFEPGQPNTIYAGNDGGLYRSSNRGVNWQHCNNGLSITEFEFLAQDYGSSRWIIGGTQDNGTERWTGSSVHTHAADGDGGDCGVNRTNPNVVFHTYYGMSPERSNNRGDWGSWSYIPPTIPTGEGSLFYPPFECSATNGDTIALGGDAVYISRNNGAAWVRLAFPSAARSSAMYIPNADNIYVGTTDGRIYKTRWTGVSWSAFTGLSSPRSNAFISDLYVNSNNLSQMWATHSTVGGGRAYYSSNGGSSWIDRSAGLPALPINSIQVDSANGNRVWAAADLGVYQSLNNGQSWSNFSNGLPNAIVGDILFHPHARVLRAGLRNRGLWEIPVDGWMTTPICGIQWRGSINAHQSKRWFTFNWPATWHVIWSIMPTTVKSGAPQVSWNVQVERANAEYATYWITVKNLTSYTVSFEGRYCILSKY